MSKRPNFLYVLADDLGWGDVSLHGSRIRTPNFDRLAQTGVELDCHYVCPVCTPTRVSLMTGRHPGRFGRHATTPTNLPVMADGYTTVAGMLRDAGYATALFGKWHLGSSPEYFPGNYGFDTSYGSMAGGVDPYTHRYKSGKHSHTWHRDGTRVDERGHATDLITDAAVDWLEQRPADEPWFCYVPFTAVHTPVRAPEDWIDQYWSNGESYDEDPVRDKSFRIYAAYTSHLDRALGRLVETLKRTDQIHDTVIVFASDNGGVTTNPSGDVAKYPGWHEDMPRTGNNDPLRGHKAQLYEGGIRTPAAIAWPSRLTHRRVTAPIQVVDWMPTFARLAGCPAPADADWDGRDVWDLITGDAEADPQRVYYWNLQHRRFAAQQDGWKLIITPTDDGERIELFHITADPYEHHELAATHPDRVAHLRALIAAEHARDDLAKRTDAPD